MNDTAPAPAEEATTHAAFADGVLELTLSHPRRRNALAAPLREALIRHLEHGLADPACRVIILTGAGGHFCAGGDISAMGQQTPLESRARMMRTSHHIIRLLVEGEKPVIAAVEGHAAGAGLSLAAACDIVVAARNAVFTCSFNRIGLVPDMGAGWTLPRRIGSGPTRLLMFRGKPLPAEEAARLGLVETLAEPGAALDQARAIARDIAAVAPLSNGMAKQLLARSQGSLAEFLKAEADAQALLRESEDHREGRDAFLSKRAPHFVGR
ncbi:enoyl-CoA hydratase/isomerase family protein [Roseomonas sp. HJA6]|uniref:Enoyl-CoA hydratase/isomerase family protein n=1 Tax=Roseomonas alba TaxID=2846776 RepID=A0ABS7A241_9PROT|nr:enoyl-CoA hydratase/isomerase family protein [Neoroseomonas alba]MBW6396233.1 enoyl-CoA hydratase/isomerase family protein [Neoroseomonas alba]